MSDEYMAPEQPAAAAAAPRATVPIQEVLAILPSGKPGAPLTFDELSAYLKQHANTDHDLDRNVRHARRDELYRDGGTKYIESVIDDVFTDQHVKDLRKKWVKHTRFNNVIKRIVNDISTIYAEPAKRSVANAGADEMYQQILKAVSIDQKAIRWSRMANLHRVVFVGFRVRERPNGVREPVIDIATPASVRVLMHPNDNSFVVGILIKACYRPARAQVDVPAWTLWTDHESVQLREDMSVIATTYQEHGFGVCPWIPLSLGIGDDGFWPGSEGEDLVAAQVSTWLANVFLLKETKSATKQRVVTGDGTNTARGQADDSEVTAELSDGQSMETVDMSMDTSLFTNTADHILDCTANNYGMSPALARHEGVQSAAARDLMRIPLNEIRKGQETPFTLFEAALAIVMAAVLYVDDPTKAFDPTGFKLKLGESMTPLSQEDRMKLFLEKRQAGLTNTYDEWSDIEGGATEEEARTAIKRNIQLETERVGEMKQLLAVSGMAGAAAAPGSGVAPPPATVGATPPPAVPPPKPVKFDANGDAIEPH